MPNNLFALVGDLTSTELRRVQVARDVQEQLAGLFVAFEGNFREGVDEEVPFSRDWKADDDELLRLPASDQVLAICEQVRAGALALEPIDPQGFQGQGIRALVFSPNDEASPLYIQYFSAAQSLGRRVFTLILDGETFSRLNRPAFSLGTKIDGIVEDGHLKFKNFNIIRRIFDVFSTYVEASDDQIENFADIEQVHIEDVERFKAITNQTTRKLISAVSQSGIFNELDVQTIEQSASSVGLVVSVANGKVVFPADKAKLKLLLRFLDHGVYQSPLAQRRFITNSKRPL